MSYNIRTTLDVQDNLNIGLNANISGSLSVTGSIYGNLNGTATSASYVLNAVSSSFANTSSYALNGGVTQLLAGPNVTLSPTNGLGQVTISSTAGGGSSFNTATGSYGSFYDTTTQTNPVANIPRSMSLNTTDITNGVSISGSTSPFNTYIKTENAGVYNIQFSAQLDKTDAGKDEILIWLRKNGIDLTDTATTVTLTNNNDKVVAAWNWFVNSAANDYYQIIWLSADTNIRLLAEPISGTHPGIPSVIVTANRVDQFLSNTGSFSGSFTGSFSGSGVNLNSIPTSAITGNFSQIATGSVTASVTPTQFSVVSGSNTELIVRGTGVTIGNIITDSHTVTGSLGISGSISSIGTNIFIGNQTITGSLTVSSSANTQLLIGTNTLFISSSNNVGIGTITPGVKLDVIGEIRASTTMFNSTTQTNNIQLSSATNLRFLSASVETARYDNNGWGFFNTAPTAKVHISGASADSLLRVGSPTQANALFVSGSGNVGIGTATPAYDLDILTPSGDTNYLRVAGNGVSTTNGNITLGNVTGTAGVFAPLLSSKSSNLSYPGMYFIGDGASGTDSGTQPMIRFDGRINNGTVATRPLIGFANAGTDLVTILANGRVGIGTTAPSAILHVRGATSGSGTTAFRVENSNLSASLTVTDFGTVTTGGPLVIGNTAAFPVNGSATIQSTFGNHVGQFEIRPNNLSSLIYFSNGGSGGGMYLGVSKYFSTPFSVYASGSVIVGDYSGFANNTAAPARFAVSGSGAQTLVNVESPGSSSIFNISGSGVVTINGSIPVTRNATGYNVTRFTNSASFDNIRVAISSSGNPVASSVSGSVNVFYNTISSVVGSAISSSINTGTIFTTGSWSVLTSATLGSGGDTITSHIQDQDRGRLYRATFIQTAGPTSGSVVIERLI
jgi:hypothetical protein